MVKPSDIGFLRTSEGYTVSVGTQRRATITKREGRWVLQFITHRLDGSETEGGSYDFRYVNDAKTFVYKVILRKGL
jgi:hypothetical protein